MGNKPRLAIVGASARAAAFSALRAGFEVVTADLFADEDLLHRCPSTRIENYPAGFAPWLAGQEVDAWMYTGALENYPELVDQMAALMQQRGCPLWGNKGQPLRRCRHPFELWEVCGEAGIKYPDTAPEPKGLPQDGSYLCKTFRGANGSGVWRLDSVATLRRGLEANAVYQKVVQGTPYAAAYAISGQESQLLGLTRQLVGDFQLGASPWAYCGSATLPSPVSESVSQMLQQIGEMLHTRFKLRGLVGVDLVIDEQDVWLIEINPRFTASMELYTDAAWQHANCFDSRRAGLACHEASPLTGKAIIFAKAPCTISETFTASALQGASKETLADIPAAGTKIDPGQPVLTILEAGPAEGVLDRLMTRAAEIESLLYA